MDYSRTRSQHPITVDFIKNWFFFGQNISTQKPNGRFCCAENKLFSGRFWNLPINNSAHFKAMPTGIENINLIELIKNLIELIKNLIELIKGQNSLGRVLIKEI